MHIGQKVEFIGEGPWLTLAPSTPHPILGQIYTVRELYQDPWSPTLGIRVMEILGEPCICPDGSILEYGWARSEFRPIVERKTDISIFTKMLKKDERVG